MCDLISSMNPQLIRLRNHDGETPLFVAARTANLRAFRRLQTHFNECPVSLMRRKDGNTVLHAAFSRQNFGLFVNKLKRHDMEFPAADGCCTRCFSTINTERDEESAASPPSGRKICMHEKTSFFYATCLQLANKAILAVLGAAGSGEIREIRRKQEQHSHAIQMIDKLLQHVTSYVYENSGTAPRFLGPVNFPSELKLSDEYVIATIKPELELKETTSTTKLEFRKADPLLIIAAKKGIVVMVEKILEAFPVAIADVDGEGKNVVMVAAENRHSKVLDHLLTLELLHYMFHQLDNQGNNLLHLAANLQLHSTSRGILSATRLLQWEYNWYQWRLKLRLIPFTYKRSTV